MELSNTVIQLASLAHESRLRIYRLLVQAGPAGLTPGKLATDLDMAAATLSFHLKELNQAGLLLKDRQGRSIIYRANYAAMSQLINNLTENCCGGAENCKTPFIT